jgi:outer membrane protein OmpA-like peptidoglycan-associated protein/tetratricopeptide (TPR) repeat protein
LFANFFKAMLNTFLKILCCFSICIFTKTKSIAQSKSDPEAYVLKAQSFWLKKDVTNAYKTLEKCVALFPNYDKAYVTLAQFYEQKSEYRKSASTLVMAANHCKNGINRFSLPAGKAYLKAMQIDSAKHWLKLAQNFENEEAKVLFKQANALGNQIKMNQEVEVIRLEDRVNSTFAEFAPIISQDGKRLYYTRRINHVNEDIVYSDWDSCGGWFTPKNIGYPPNSASNESYQNISLDNHYLFFMRSDNRSENGWDKGGFDLFMSYRIHADSAWSIAQSFGATINSPSFEGMPCLSSDHSTLYFVSDRPGGYGGLDIWVSHFKFGLWQKPINLGPQINTKGNDIAPFIAADNQTLYFSSNGHLGIGGLDLFMAHKVNDSVWSNPVNLGIPINSSSNEQSIFISNNGTTALFASDRGKKTGDYDIFSATLTSSLKPKPTLLINGKIIDKMTNQIAEVGNLTLFDQSGNEIAHYYSNKGDGSLCITVPVKDSIWYTARAFNYHPLDGVFYFDSTSDTAINFDFTLYSKTYQRPTKDSLITTIRFNKNTTELTSVDKIQLLESIQFFKKWSELEIIVNSYTDNTGTPLINLEKSTQRAMKVVDVFLEYGFAPSQLNAIGYGESNPIVENDTPENQDINRRVEIVVRFPI